MATFPKEQWSQVAPDGGDDDAPSAMVAAVTCANCLRLVVTFEHGYWAAQMGGGWDGTGTIVIWPQGVSLGRTPATEVPQSLGSLFTEASIVLALSPRASAALSRRCLQQLLVDAGGAPPGDLYKQIEWAVASGGLPSHLIDSLHAVRAIGNIGAHTQKSTSTGDVVDVEPGEAEWNLDTLEGLFDFYYVQPAKTAARKAALNAKQAAIGKPPIQ